MMSKYPLQILFVVLFILFTYASLQEPHVTKPGLLPPGVESVN